MPELRGEKILITGPAGQIAFPIAEHLVRENEVWGIAHFGDPATRERCEEIGVKTRVVDLADPDFDGLPDDITYLLHLAIFQSPSADYDHALRVNAEGTGLLMSRFRGAKACLVVSTTAVYTLPEDPHRRVLETDPLGSSPQPFAETYPSSKIAQEAMARFAAREWGLPTTIARMNVSYGDNGGLPAMQLDAICAGQPIELQRGRDSICAPIHEVDIVAQVPGLLEGAGVPATITNWAGDEGVDVREYCEYLAELTGREAVFQDVDLGIAHTVPDPTRRQQLVGPCRVGWREGMRRLLAARHPEIELRA